MYAFTRPCAKPCAKPVKKTFVILILVISKAALLTTCFLTVFETVDVPEVLNNLATFAFALLQVLAAHFPAAELAILSPATCNNVLSAVLAPAWGAIARSTKTCDAWAAWVAVPPEVITSPAISPACAASSCEAPALMAWAAPSPAAAEAAASPPDFTKSFPAASPAAFAISCVPPLLTVSDAACPAATFDPSVAPSRNPSATIACSAANAAACATIKQLKPTVNAIVRAVPTSIAVPGSQDPVT